LELTLPFGEESEGGRFEAERSEEFGGFGEV